MIKYKKMKLIKYFFAVVTAMLVFTSCEKEGVITIPITTTKATFNFESLSGKFKDVSYSDLVVTLTELNTKEVMTINVTDFPLLNVELEQGSYEVSVIGNVKYTLDGVQQTGKVGAFKNELNLTRETESIYVQLVLKAFSKDFIIEEIFFTGTLMPDGKKSYFGDKYIKLYNNTDKTLYADGLLIAQSRFQTDMKYTYNPDIMKEAFTADAIIQIPGSGKDYPVKPGESITITDTAINHTEYNSNSFDLSGANFEMFYENTDDVDNANVKNVENLFDRLVIHDRGVKSFVIARLPKDVTKEKFLVDNIYHYVSEEGQDFMGWGIIPEDEGDAIKIFNTWIIDAVNLSLESDFQWIVTSESLDSGWTHCGNGGNSRYGKAVGRKVLQEVDGKRILKDTNNSINDFEPSVKPSLMK